MASNHLPRREKNRWRTEKMTCKTMKQNENEQNYKKTVHAGRGRETKWEIPGEKSVLDIVFVR